MAICTADTVLNGVYGEIWDDTNFKRGMHYDVCRQSVYLCKVAIQNKSPQMAGIHASNAVRAVKKILRMNDYFLFDEQEKI